MWNLFFAYVIFYKSYFFVFFLKTFSENNKVKCNELISSRDSISAAATRTG